jgi:hypothetical protein
MESCTTNPVFKPSDPGRATQTARGVLPPGERRSFRAADVITGASRELLAQGFTLTEAGNLAAYLIGLGRTNDGWTIDEIERLLFVRHLVSRQRIRS